MTNQTVAGAFPSGNPHDNATRGAVVTFFRLFPGCRPPQRADRAVGGLLPTRAFRYCEPVVTASSFGWYLFPPINFSLMWDGSEVIWTYDGAESWFPLDSAQLPGFAAYFDQSVPSDLKSFSPPFLGAPPEPGLVQVWTGYLARTQPDWSLLIRPVANFPRAHSYEFYEGIVETDHWFGPLFTNIRITKTDVPVRFQTGIPFIQVQPIHRSIYADKVLDNFDLVLDISQMQPDDWSSYYRTVVQPNTNPTRHHGGYAAAVRKRKKSEM